MFLDFNALENNQMNSVDEGVPSMTIPNSTRSERENEINMLNRKTSSGRIVSKINTGRGPSLKSYLNRNQ